MESRPPDYLLLVPESEEFRSVRHRRRLCLAASVLALGLIGVSLKPVIHHLREGQAQRLAEEGAQLVAKEDWQNAAQKIGQAALLAPNNPAVLRSEAKFLTATHHFGDALKTWNGLAQGNHPFAPEDRRDFARAALEEGDVKVASVQIEQLSRLHPDHPANALLEARLHDRAGDPEVAVKAAMRVLYSTESDEKEIWEATQLIFSDATEAADRAKAWAALEKLAQGQTKLALEALLSICAQVLLASDSSASGNFDTAKMIERLEKHPLADARSKLQAIDLRIKLEPSRRDALMQKAISLPKDGDDTSLAALCLWLLTHKQPAVALDLLPLERISGQRELSEARIESLCALGQWRELSDELQDLRNNFNLDEVTVQTYLAQSAARLGEDAALNNAWERALEVAAGNRGKLLFVGHVAEKEKEFDRAEAAYREAIDLAPQDRGAYALLLRLTISRGGAGRAHEIFEAMLQRWPEDSGLRNGFNYTGLLSGKLSPAAVRETMEQLVTQHPSNPAFRATLALAILREGDPTSALQAFGDSIKADSAASPGPSALAVYAAVAAANRMSSAARTALEHLATEELLPEERTLVEPVVRDLTSNTGQAQIR